MSPASIFLLHLVLGYVAWLMCFRAYVWPRLASMDRRDAQRAIATLHSFRFFGLVFILPGVVGPQLPHDFATFAAGGDLVAGLLALAALLAARTRVLFGLLVAGYNVVGVADLLVDYGHGIALGLPALSGQLGAAYAIPVLVVPLLMITHVAAFYLLARPRPQPLPARRDANGRIGLSR